MITIGIDPGLTGSVAFIDHRSVVIEDMPTVATGGKGMVKRKVDPRGLCDLIRRHVPPGMTAEAVVEAVHTVPGQRNSPQSQGSLMHSAGVIEAVLVLLRMPPVYVQPQTWKRHYGLGADKKRALDVARGLFPAAAHLLTRAKDHNRAEGLLIAHYGRKEQA